MIYSIHSSTRSEIQLCQNAEFAWIITLLQKTRCCDLRTTWYSICVKAAAVIVAVAMIYADQRLGCQVHVTKDRDITAVYNSSFSNRLALAWFQSSSRSLFRGTSVANDTWSTTQLVEALLMIQNLFGCVSFQRMYAVS